MVSVALTASAPSFSGKSNDVDCVMPGVSENCECCHAPVALVKAGSAVCEESSDLSLRLLSELSSEKVAFLFWLDCLSGGPFMWMTRLRRTTVARRFYVHSLSLNVNRWMFKCSLC